LNVGSWRRTTTTETDRPRHKQRRKQTDREGKREGELENGVRELPSGESGARGEEAVYLPG